uniref:(northern house mosquito) hypothetical protein n=1 Tax=Culex pipiens TaxID=7175 RepID=A0A8D8F550_CULPI
MRSTRRTARRPTTSLPTRTRTITRRRTTRIRTTTTRRKNPARRKRAASRPAKAPTRRSRDVFLFGSAQMEQATGWVDFESTRCIVGLFLYQMSPGGGAIAIARGLFE